MLLSVVDRCPLVRLSAVRVQRDHVGCDAVAVLVVPAQGADPDTVHHAVVAQLNRNLAVAPAVEIVTEAHLTELEHRSLQHTNMVKIARFFDLRQEAARL